MKRTSVTVPEDFYTEVARGNVVGHSMVHQAGGNAAVLSGVFTPLVSSGVLNFQTTPLPVRIRAGGDAADDVAGTGARTILIRGINGDRKLASEIINTAGISASAPTALSWWRLFRAEVLDSGTYATIAAGANAADIVIEDTNGLALIQIDADLGLSQHAAFAVPLGSRGYFLGFSATVDANKAANVRFMTREVFSTVAPPGMQAKCQRLFFDGVIGSKALSAKSPIFELPELTDIWVEASGGTVNSEVDIDFEILLVKNTERRF